MMGLPSYEEQDFHTVLQARCHVEGGFPSTGAAGFHDGILAGGAGLGWI